MSERWDEDDIGDQHGRTVLVTGANSGLGFETARALAQKGATVVLGCRNPERAAAARAAIEATEPSGTAELLSMDLADLDTVRAAAEEFRSRHDRLDVLVNNAGLMAIPRRRTAQGHEMQFGVNHLGHFALTGLLVDLLVASGPARVVSVSSQGHRPGRMHFDDVDFSRRYRPWQAYFQSKLANLLFTRELQRRFAAAGVEAIAVAAHPGGSDTHLGHENPGGVLNTLADRARPLIERFLLQSAAMGALPTLRAATDPEVDGDDYFGPSGLFEQAGYPVKVGRSRRARNDADALRLWELSVARTGVDYAAVDR